MKTTALAVLVFVTLGTPVSAQPAGGEAWFLGLAPGGALRWQDGSVRTCPEDDCLPFTNGSGAGFSIGLRALYPIGKDLFLRGGAGWEQAGSTFTETRRNYPFLGENNSVEIVDLRDELETTISTLQFEAGIAYRLLETGVYLSAGPMLVLPLSANWKQTETITDPPGVVFTRGGGDVVLLDTDVPDLSPFLGLRIGAGALLPLTDMLAFSPEAHYTLPLGDMQSDLGWSMSGLDVSVAVMMRM